MYAFNALISSFIFVAHDDAVADDVEDIVDTVFFALDVDVPKNPNFVEVLVAMYRYELFIEIDVFSIPIKELVFSNFPDPVNVIFAPLIAQLSEVPP